MFAIVSPKHNKRKSGLSTQFGAAPAAILWARDSRRDSSQRGIAGRGGVDFCRTYPTNYSSMIDSRYPWGFGAIAEALRGRVKEAAPGRIQLLTGPRQVGKTTLLLELAGELGSRALYAAGDGPEAAAPGFWESFWAQARSLGRPKAPAVVMLDEVHAIPNWTARLKAQWDSIRRRSEPVQIIVTGSSALRIGPEVRESLAGRFERLTLAHWQAAELARVFRLSRSAAARHVVTLGGYPALVALRGDPQRAVAYLRESIVEPAIGRDVLALGAIRRPAMLRRVFAACALSPAQIVSLQKMRGRLDDAGALETIAHYLGLLEEAFLVAPLQKHAVRPLRRRAAPPKLVVLNNGLLAAQDPRGIPDERGEPDRFGAWVENACIAAVRNAGQNAAYWREEPLEVDVIVEGDWGALAIEVKTGPIRLRDLDGLREFCRRNPRFRPLVVGSASNRAALTHAGIPVTTWMDFLHDGPTV